MFVWILLYLYFHDWRGALRPTITGVLAAIWGLGALFKVPASRSWVLTAVVLVAVPLAPPLPPLGVN